MIRCLCEKIRENSNLFKSDIVSTKREIENIKTTNVNILLNRVREDKKKNQKKILFTFLMSILICFLSLYFII